MNAYIAAIVRDIRRGELTRDIDELSVKKG